MGGFQIHWLVHMEVSKRTCFIILQDLYKCYMFFSMYKIFHSKNKQSGGSGK